MKELTLTHNLPRSIRGRKKVVQTKFYGIVEQGMLVLNLKIKDTNTGDIETLDAVSTSKKRVQRMMKMLSYKGSNYKLVECDITYHVPTR